MKKIKPTIYSNYFACIEDTHKKSEDQKKMTTAANGLANRGTIMINCVRHKKFDFDRKIIYINSMITRMKQIWKENSLVRKVITHIFYWAVTVGMFSTVVLIHEKPAFVIEINLAFLLPNIIPVYVHFYFFNRYFEQKKYFRYVAGLLFCIFGIGLFNEYLFFLIVSDPANSDTSGIVNAAAAVFITTGLKYFKAGIKQQFLLQEVRYKHLQTELALLKSQVNPHFFFNTLNNLYSLSLDNSKKLPEVILKLVNLMQYMLDSSENNQVRLDQEIQFIENYLSLEKLRLSDKSRIRFDVTGNTAGKMIAPMLVIPFVENSFKHGISATTGDSYIDIYLKSVNNTVSFSIENNKPEKSTTNPATSPQLGLQNVKRRLQLLYPGKHKLDINDNRTSYQVNLDIRL